ncbi:MAG: hypothetical protein NXI10_04225 [bacterium]|nr:hypothetical protein [bacterium]
MLSKGILMLFLMLGGYLSAQDTLMHNGDTIVYLWSAEHQFKMNPDDIWSVDKLENVYISDGESIKKYDSTGVLKFQQSIKSFGQVTQLAPVNSMKLIYFSQEQQTLCFLDNTLTATEDCIDLADYQIYNAEWIATSTRPELLWVYDNVNSTLKLISLNTLGEVNLEIVNVMGILGLNSIDKILEAGQYLYVFDASKGVYQLDFYGGLLNKWDSIGETTIAADQESHLFRLRNEEVVTLGLLQGAIEEQVIFQLPKEGISEMQIMGTHLYFRTSKTVHKYTLHFNN